MLLECELIFLILVSASLFDIWQYKVPNALCVAALVISLFRRFQSQGLPGVIPWLAGIFIPFFLCYLLCCCHMLGAGDSKFFSVIGSFVGVSVWFRIMFASLCVGAVMSLVKMIIYRNAIQRFAKMFSYLSLCIRTGKWTPYYDREQEGEQGIIPFTVAISIATLWCLYG